MAQKAFWGLNRLFYFWGLFQGDQNMVSRRKFGVEDRNDPGAETSSSQAQLSVKKNKVLDDRGQKKAENVESQNLVPTS